MDTFKYFTLLNINEGDCYFKLDLVRGYCDKRCSLCKKCSNPDIVKIIKHKYAKFYEKYFIKHQNRVAFLSQELGNQLSLNSKDQVTLVQAALLHDVGKLAIPEEILFKKGKLTLKEFEDIKSHSLFGTFYLKGSGFSEDVAKIVKYHHERYDGKGYPDGLKGDEIPYLARILSICDSFDAMVAGRHYKKPLSTNKAIKELSMNSGTQFDSDIVDKLISILQKKEEAKVV